MSKLTFIEVPLLSVKTVSKLFAWWIIEVRLLVLHVLQRLEVSNNQLTGTLPQSWLKQGMMCYTALVNNTGVT